MIKEGEWRWKMGCSGVDMWIVCVCVCVWVIASCNIRVRLENFELVITFML